MMTDVPRREPKLAVVLRRHLDCDGPNVIAK